MKRSTSVNVFIKLDSWLSKEEYKNGKDAAIVAVALAALCIAVAISGLVLGNFLATVAVPLIILGGVLLVIVGIAAIISVKRQPVKEGETILILEAMKMEHAMKSDCDGVVKSVNVKKGDQVKGRQLLVEVVNETANQEMAELEPA